MEWTDSSTEEGMFKHRKLKGKRENTEQHGKSCWQQKEMEGKEEKSYSKKREQRSRADFQFSSQDWLDAFHAAPHQHHCWLSLYHKKLNRQFITVESSLSFGIVDVFELVDSFFFIFAWEPSAELESDFLTLFPFSQVHGHGGRRPAVYNFSSIRAGVWDGGWWVPFERKWEEKQSWRRRCNFTRCCHGGDIHFHRRRSNEAFAAELLRFFCALRICTSQNVCRERRKKKAVNYLQALKLLRYLTVSMKATHTSRLDPASTAREVH